MSVASSEKKVIAPLAPEVEEEIVRFEQNIKALRSGAMDPNEFKKFRLNNGVYGIRNADRKQSGHRGLARVGRFSGILGTLLAILAVIVFIVVATALHTTESSVSGLVNRIKDEINSVHVKAPDVNAPSSAGPSSGGTSSGGSSSSGSSSGGTAAPGQ